MISSVWEFDDKKWSMESPENFARILQESYDKTRCKTIQDYDFRKIFIWSDTIVPLKSPKWFFKS